MEDERYPEALMTSRELSEYLTIPLATLYRWRTYGDGPRAIKVGKHGRYRHEDVQEWLDAHYADVS